MKIILAKPSTGRKELSTHARDRRPLTTPLWRFVYEYTMGVLEQGMLEGEESASNEGGSGDEGR